MFWVQVIIITFVLLALKQDIRRVLSFGLELNSGYLVAEYVAYIQSQFYSSEHFI